MHRLATCSLALSLLAGAAPVGAQRGVPARSPQLIATLDSLAAAFVSANKAPGGAVAVVRGADTLLFRGYGVANLEVHVPVATHSVFRIGSVTKQFTAAAVLQLAEEGKLALTDSIGRWLPNLPPAWRAVTITHLLNHTSGIPSYTDAGEPWVKRWAEEMTGKDIVAITEAKPLDFAIGSSWKYNNSGYVLLGMLIEARAGRSWSDDLAARWFVPLGLTRTRFCPTQPVIADRASGYTRSSGDSAWANSTYLSMSQPHAAGALCSTIGDLLTWNRALHSGRVLQPASYTAMTTPVGAAVRNRYGFGIGRDSLGPYVSLSHTGGIPGFLTANLYVPDAQLSVTVLTNGDNAGPDGLAKQLARAALGLRDERVPVQGLREP